MAWTFCLKCPHKKKSHSLRSGNLIGHGRNPFFEMILEPNIECIRKATEISPADDGVLAVKNIQPYSSMNFNEDLKFHPYKFQMGQQQQPADFNSRKTFAREMLAILNDSPDALKNLPFIDEAHFNFFGFTNCQNTRYWALQNPKKSLENLSAVQNYSVLRC